MFLLENTPGVCFRPNMARKHTRVALTLAAMGLWQAGASVARAACDTAHAPAVPVVKGLAYAQARQAILGGGWAPVAGHPHNDLSNNEQTFRERGFSELQFCRISADSYCRFQFSAGQVALWVTTLGEENAALDSHAEVKSARLGCVGEAAPE